MKINVQYFFHYKAKISEFKTLFIIIFENNKMILKFFCNQFKSKFKVCSDCTINQHLSANTRMDGFIINI